MEDGQASLRCIYCGDDENAGVAVRHCRPQAGHGCIQCGHVPDDIGGIPFFGGFEPADFPSLVGFVAAGTLGGSHADIDFERRIDALLSEYHRAEDKEEFIREHPDDVVRAPWFRDSRYHDWIQANALLDILPAGQASVLCLVSGAITDAVPFVDRGAKVTCLSPVPSVLVDGRANLPGVQWIGGLPQVLPFRNESFDVVFAKGSLRRLRSRREVLREMLRVLKPGGRIFTLGDPIRPDDSDDSLEFEVFNRHEVVLSGLNEGIIRFGDIYDTLAAFGDQIEIEMIASVQDASALQGAYPVGDGAFNDFWVPCWPENIAYLRQAHGAGLCVAARKVRSIDIPAERQSHYVLPAGLLASWIGDPETAFARLMAWAPDDLVNLPFPGHEQNWFSLLNGWQRPEPPYDHRRGFQRARWLLRQPGATTLAFSARAVDGERELEIFINGSSACSAKIDGEWRRVELDVAEAAGGMPFLVEIRLGGNLEGLNFDQRCFDIRDRVLA